jgi:hypothetical protein
LRFNPLALPGCDLGVVLRRINLLFRAEPRDRIILVNSSALPSKSERRQAVWDQFKATRGKEIIPPIYKGNIDDAKKIASGIQSERLAKIASRA